ncbi:MAG: GAK system CofD-like protein [Desulfosalsimonas sp.]|uniref:GAK system CofD-like protein n=1 Tax=Desulfosalsimonas sp. TaxID=3073848 RepID=UPI003970D169
MKNPQFSPAYFEISRKARLPDPIRLARYEKVPDLGPKLLFFSGGTALRQLSARLIRYTHNSIHVITPFDSGGSSAQLRNAFHMPAVGDIRNRLMALADQGIHGNQEIFALFSHRLPKNAGRESLVEDITRMASGKHRLVARIPDPMRKLIRNHLLSFLDSMPENFDLRGASIGNLILAAGYLNNRRLLDPVIYLFSMLVRVRGTVRPVVNKHRHLVAELDSGALRVGQHQFTGKQTEPINEEIKRVYLASNKKSPEPVEVQIRSKMRELIRSADLICYPMGSFYSSLIANLLPSGVGDAICGVRCPKIFVPSTYPDPELRGLDPTRQTEILLSYLKADDPGRIQNPQVLDAVLVDRKNGQYTAPVDEKKLNEMQVRVIDYGLVSHQSRPAVDAGRLAQCLLSLT